MRTITYTIKRYGTTIAVITDVTDLPFGDFITKVANKKLALFQKQTTHKLRITSATEDIEPR